MKLALITGITGMVGSHLADFLLENTDWKIYGLTRWNDGMDNIEHLTERVNNKDRIELVYGDINDLSSMLHVFEKVSPDYVFHLAAQSYPKTSFESPLDTLETKYLAECQKSFCQFMKMWGFIQHLLTPSPKLALILSAGFMQKHME